MGLSANDSACWNLASCLRLVFVSNLLGTENGRQTEHTTLKLEVFKRSEHKKGSALWLKGDSTAMQHALS